MSDEVLVIGDIVLMSRMLRATLIRAFETWVQVTDEVAMNGESIEQM